MARERDRVNLVIITGPVWLAVRDSEAKTNTEKMVVVVVVMLPDGAERCPTISWFKREISPDLRDLRSSLYFVPIRY